MSDPLPPSPAPGRSVLVTGGSTGIGLAIAERFARGGDRVLITGRSDEKLQAAQATLSGLGLDVETVRGSVAAEDEIDRVLTIARRTFGTIDVLINNAGIGPESILLETAAQTWDEIQNTNLRGAFLMSRGGANLMIEGGHGGVILFTSSINAIQPVSPAVAYSVSKAGLDAFIRGLAVELAPHGIRVCGVNPGYIETPLLDDVYPDPEVRDKWVADRTRRVPLGRLGRPAEVAEIFWFLASPACSYVTGTSVVVDGGRTAAP